MLERSLCPSGLALRRSVSEASRVNSNGNGQNGHGAAAINVGQVVTPAPAVIAELAAACVKFVEAAVGVKLDYEPETLSILDHYLEEGRRAAKARPEAAALVANAAGAYFGEVVRRRYASWWRTEGSDPAFYRIELGPVYLSFSPVQLIADALLRDDEKDETGEKDAKEGEAEATEAGIERFEVSDDDQAAVEERLAELPAVSEREFYAPSTRLEVIDITIDAIRSRRMGEGDSGDADLTPADYDE